MRQRCPRGFYTVKTALRCTTVTNGAIVIHTQRLKSNPGGNLLS
ncbi:chemotaxis protein [Escherichia coli]|nr:chemotaxis protein [Escherichia coli]TFY46080.1 chemotaxis protein [Escherichia coli]